MGLTQRRIPTFISIHLRGVWEEMVAHNLRSATVLRDRGRGWAARAETTCRERKNAPGYCCTVREATCARGAASYRLHSSMSLSVTVWGRLTAQWQHLALCFPFVKIWLHWITITTSTSCPLRSPPALHPHPQPPSPPLPTQPPLYPFPTPSQIPPAGSSLDDTLSICLIISPLATLLWTLSRQHILLTGKSWGATATSIGLPGGSPRGPHFLWHNQLFTVKFKTLDNSNIIGWLYTQ